MGRKKDPVPAVVKINYTKSCYDGKMGIHEARRELGIDNKNISEWVDRYKENT